MAWLSRILGRPPSAIAQPAPQPAQAFSVAHLEALHRSLAAQRALAAGAPAPAPAPAAPARGAGTAGVYDAAVVVDTLKQISELMVFGDKHNAERFFEVFCERNMLRTFVELFQEARNGGVGGDADGEVRVQVLQTVSILLMNIANQRSLFYLLSNNHVNDLIASPFDSAHEELLGYYISLLKTLSLSFNRDTIQFFYFRSVVKKSAAATAAAGPAAAGSPAAQQVVENFPLYTQAVRFFAHEESMVRTAVRAITLNVFNTADASLRRFLCRGEHSAYPEQLALQLQRSIVKLSAAVAAWHSDVRVASGSGDGGSSTPTSGSTPTAHPAASPFPSSSAQADGSTSEVGETMPPWLPAAYAWGKTVPVTLDFLLDQVALGGSQASSGRQGPVRTLDHARAEVGDLLSNVLDECFYLQDVMAIGQREIEERAATTSASASFSSDGVAGEAASRPVTSPGELSSCAAPATPPKAMQVSVTEDGGSILPITDAVCDYLIAHVLDPVILASWRRAGGSGTAHAADVRRLSALTIDPGVAMLLLANMLQIFSYRRLSRWLEKALFAEGGAPHQAGEGSTADAGASNTVGTSSAWRPRTLRDVALGLVLSRDHRLSGCALLVLRAMLRLSGSSARSLAAAGLLPRTQWTQFSSAGPSASESAVCPPPSALSPPALSAVLGTPVAERPSLPGTARPPLHLGDSGGPRLRSTTLGGAGSPSAALSPGDISRTGRAKSASAVSEPELDSDLAARGGGNDGNSIGGGIRALRTSTPIPSAARALRTSFASPESSSAERRPTSDVLERYAARTGETVSVMLLLLCSDPPPRPVNLQLALTLVIELTYDPRPAPTVGASAVAPSLAGDHILLLRHACARLGAAISAPVAKAYAMTDAGALLRLLHATEVAAEDEARNSLVLSCCTHLAVEILGAPVCAQDASASSHSGHGPQCRAASVVNSMASKLCDADFSAESADFLLPTKPGPSPRYWFAATASASEYAAVSDHSVGGNGSDGGSPTPALSAVAAAEAAVARPRFRSPLGYLGDGITDFSRRLQQLFVLRSLLFGVAGGSVSRLVTTAYSSPPSPQNGAAAAKPVEDLEAEDLTCSAFCLDPSVRSLAPPLDGIAPSNSFSLTGLPWFQATLFPVQLAPGIAATAATTRLQAALALRRRLGVVLGTSYLVVTDVLHPRAATPEAAAAHAATAATAGATSPSSSGAASAPAAAVRLRGRAQLVAPLHLASLHLVSPADASPAILDVRLIAGPDGGAVTGSGAAGLASAGDAAAPSPASVASVSASAGGFLHPPRRFGFALALESAEVAQRAVEHVKAASARVVTAKVAVIKDLASVPLTNSLSCS